MANHPSAAKRARQNVKRAQRNASIKSRVKTAIKSFRHALSHADVSVVKTTFNVATRQLRKAASQGVLHKKTAWRHVSRLATAFNAYTHPDTPHVP